MASTIPEKSYEADSSSAPASSEDKGFTLESLKEHGTRESFYMLLHDKVYDVTAFLDEHPGGDEVMLEEAGKDATEAFEDVGHSDEARAMLTKMYLGEFKGEKTGKAAKRAVSGSSTSSSSSSSGFPIWTIPAALFFAYLAWRMFLA